MLAATANDQTLGAYQTLRENTWGGGVTVSILDSNAGYTFSDRETDLADSILSLGREGARTLVTDQLTLFLNPETSAEEIATKFELHQPPPPLADRACSVLEFRQ